MIHITILASYIALNYYVHTMQVQCDMCMPKMVPWQMHTDEIKEVFDKKPAMQNSHILLVQ